MRQVKKGSTNVSVDLYIIDSTDGTPELGVLFNTAGIDLEYRRQDNFVVNITEADLATPDLEDIHLDGGFLEIGHGYYRFDLPDAAFATGVETVSIQGTVTGMIVLPQTIQLVDFDPEDGVRLGLTALPDAAADAIGGLPISDAGGLDLDVKLANTNEITVARMGALTDWIDAGRLDAILDLIKTAADAIKVVTDKFVFTTANQVDAQPISMAANVITAASIAANALTAAKIATDAIGAAQLAVTAAQKIRDEILPVTNVALSNIPFIFVAASDHVTPVTGATGVTGERSIDGGAYVGVSGTIAEISDGSYQFDALAADMNGGIITFKFSATGGTPGAADDTFVSIVTNIGV